MKALKVLLVGNYAPDRQESMQRFAELMKSELQHRGCRVRLLRPRAIANRAARPPVGRSKWLGYVDKMLLFAPVLRRAARWADVVHICDHSNALYIPLLRRVPHIVTCHDVIAITSALGSGVPDSREPGSASHAGQTGKSGVLLQRAILRGLRQAQAVACDSGKTRRDLLEVSGRRPERTPLVSIGQNYRYGPLEAAHARRMIEPLLAARFFERGFILHVGGNQWYKNRLGVLSIYKYLQLALGPERSPMLVMAGKEFTPEMRRLVSESGLSDSVASLEGCSNEELRALYCSAEMLLFPSLREGFGWPIIEAQACGCRVLTTGEEPMTEVGGQAACYLDPHHLERAAEEALAMLSEPAQSRQSRIEAGMLNAARFDAGRMAESYLSLYQSLRVSSRNGSPNNSRRR